MTEEIKTQPNELAEFQRADCELAKLVEKHKGRVYDLTVKKDFDQLKAARAEFRSFRFGIANTSKAANSRFNELKKQLTSDTNRITNMVRKYEDPLDVQIKAHEKAVAEAKEKKAKADRERVNKIQEYITSLASTADRCRGKNSEEIAPVIEGVKAYEITAFFEEFTDQAHGAKTKAIADLETMHGELVKEEEAALARIEEQKRLDEQKAEQDERERVLGIKGRLQNMSAVPNQYVSASAAEITIALDTVKEIKPGEKFDEFEDEAVSIWMTTIAALELQLAVAKEKEAKAKAETPAEDQVVEEPAQTPKEEPEATATTKTKAPSAEAPAETVKEEEPKTAAKPKTLAELREEKETGGSGDAYVMARHFQDFKREVMTLRNDYWGPSKPSVGEFCDWILENMADEFGGE